MHDLVIKGGTVVDGTGNPSYQADIAVDDGRIVEVGKVRDGGRKTIDAHGLIVTPGFVDTHTHYDGQVTWDPLLTSSCWHGVTTVTMGNCGVGFAPAHPDRHDWLISLMEGVEDIPGAVLAEGIRWGWETFPEYLDLIERTPLALDVTCQIPHGPVRAYVMGDRGAANEPATDEDIAAMANIVGEAIRAGAFAFTTSRTHMHKTSHGVPVPGTIATEAELWAIGRAIRDAGRGVVEVVQHGVVGEGGDHWEDLRGELDWMARLSKLTRQNVIYAMFQNDRYPEDWRDVLKYTEEANADGAKLWAMTADRPVGAVIGAQMPGEGFSPLAYWNPLRFHPSYKALVKLPFEEMIARLRDPETKRRVLAEQPDYDLPDLGAAFGRGVEGLARLYPLTDPVDYEPDESKSIIGLAAAAGRDPMEFFYDQLTGNSGKNLFLVPMLNYTYGNCEPLLEIMKHPNSVVGLGDGGAHSQNLCDASNTTYMLTHWVRDRSRGERVGLEWAVRKLTAEPAEVWGITDRGRLAPGLKADINVIDWENLQIDPPEVAYDLPAGGNRIVQTARGYVATINSGEVIVENGRETGARPGRLVRSSEMR